MSSPLAVAAVTAVLKDLLNEGMINNDLSAVGSFSVSSLPPDRVSTGDVEPNRLNLFMYQVTPNLGWRNVGLASRSPGGDLLTNPPLALDLHYMLTAYGQADLNAEILLGYAMELLHDTPVLTRAAIRASLSPNNPINVALIPNDGEGRTAIDLADQVEAIKITPHYLSADELSRLWTAMQARYRPTVAYQVSTVLIQGTRPTRSALPVLTRGAGDRGVSSQAGGVPPGPAWAALGSVTINAADKSGTHQNAELGDTLLLAGALLAGTTVTAVFSHRLLADSIELVIDKTSTAQQAVVVLPAATAGTAAADWPAGNYTVGLRIESAGVAPRLTNTVAFALAPRLSASPQLTATASTLDLTVNFFPQLWPGQQVDLFVGGEPFRPAAVAAKTASLTVSILSVAPADGSVPLRLRIDGVDSLVVRDMSAQPPQFDPQQMVTLPNPLP